MRYPGFRGACLAEFVGRTTAQYSDSVRANFTRYVKLDVAALRAMIWLNHYTAEGRNWFGQKIARTRFHGLDRHRDVALAGEKDNWNCDLGFSQPSLGFWATPRRPATRRFTFGHGVRGDPATRFFKTTP